MRLDFLQSELEAIYGPRNDIWLPTLLERMAFLSIAVSDFHRAYRQEVGWRAYQVALARIFARLVCFAHFFKDEPMRLAYGTAQKYPGLTCAYCGQKPCGPPCDPNNRPPVKLITPSPTLLGRYLGEIQGDLGALYGSANEIKGLDNIICRLQSEAAELQSVTMRLLRHPVDPTEIRLELADGVAWIMAAANHSLVQVDLEKAVITRFTPVCWKCGERPCTQCGEFNMEPIDWIAWLRGQPGELEK